MVRDLKKILETLEVHEATQERIKTIQLAENSSLKDTLNALSVLSGTVKEITDNTAGSIDCLNDKKIGISSKTLLLNRPKKRQTLGFALLK